MFFSIDCHRISPCPKSFWSLASRPVVWRRSTIRMLTSHDSIGIWVSQTPRRIPPRLLILGVLDTEKHLLGYLKYQLLTLNSHVFRVGLSNPSPSNPSPVRILLLRHARSTLSCLTRPLLRQRLNHFRNRSCLCPIRLFIRRICEGIEATKEPKFLQVADESRDILSSLDLHVEHQHSPCSRACPM